MNKITADQAKALNEQIRISITQGVLQALGPDNIVKVTSASLTTNALEPIGNQIIVSFIIETYPKAP